MPRNRYERNVKNSNPLAPDTVTMPGDSGLFGGHPAPGFNQYPETRGNVIPPRKFQETDLSAPPNQLEREVDTPNIAESYGLQKPGTTRIISGRNRYQTEVKTNITGK